MWIVYAAAKVVWWAGVNPVLGFLVYHGSLLIPVMLLVHRRTRRRWHLLLVGLGVQLALHAVLVLWMVAPGEGHHFDLRAALHILVNVIGLFFYASVASASWLEATAARRGAQGTSLS